MHEIWALIEALFRKSSNWKRALTLMEEMPRRRVDLSGVEAGCFVSAARKNLADGLVLPMLAGVLKKWLDEECIPKPANVSKLGALLAEKPGILVVHKPAGITTENFVKMVEVAVAVPLCAVSRLDHPTSGVLPIAVGKEDSGPSKWLKAQFAGRLVIKEYLCLCEGQSLGAVGQKGRLSNALLPGAFQAHTEVCSFGREADTFFTVQARYSTEACHLQQNPRCIISTFKHIQTGLEFLQKSFIVEGRQFFFTMSSSAEFWYFLALQMPCR